MSTTSMRNTICFSLLALVLLVSCTVQPQIRELASGVTSDSETIHINNCGGLGEAQQTASRSFSVDGTLGAKVYGVIDAQYGQYRSVSKSHTMTAPPNTNMEFELKWTERYFTGVVAIDNQEGNYNVRVPVSVDQVSSVSIPCYVNPTTYGGQTVINTEAPQVPVSGMQAPVYTSKEPPSPHYEYSVYQCKPGYSAMDLKFSWTPPADTSNVSGYEIIVKKYEDEFGNYASVGYGGGYGSEGAATVPCKPGKYQWSVKTNYSSGESSDWSYPMDFIIK